MSNETQSHEAAPPAGGIPVTRWSLVMLAGGPDESRAQAALGELYEAYRKPLLGLLVSKGFPPVGFEHCLAPDDLLNGFFAHLISKQGLGKARKEVGRFRDFLRTSLMNFARDEWDKARAQKRGGGTIPTPLESPTESGTRELPIIAEGSPDQDFDRAWAVQLLSLAMDRLKRHYHQRGRAELFEVLHPSLAGGGRETGAYLQWATQLKMSEGALRTEMSRMKDRWKLTIEEEIAETLPHPTAEAVKAEKRALFAALSSN